MEAGGGGEYVACLQRSRAGGWHGDLCGVESGLAGRGLHMYNTGEMINRPHLRMGAQDSYGRAKSRRIT